MANDTVEFKQKI